MRLQQAGATVVNWAVLAAMLQWDWRRPTAAGTLKSVFGGHLPFYEWLANNQSFTKDAAAQAAGASPQRQTEPA
jgi:hypothetical protein